MKRLYAYLFPGNEWYMPKWMEAAFLVGTLLVCAAVLIVSALKGSR